MAPGSACGPRVLPSPGRARSWRAGRAGGVLAGGAVRCRLVSPWSKPAETKAMARRLIGALALDGSWLCLRASGAAKPVTGAELAIWSSWRSVGRWCCALPAGVALVEACGDQGDGATVDRRACARWLLALPAGLGRCQARDGRGAGELVELAGVGRWCGALPAGVALVEACGDQGDGATVDRRACARWLLALPAGLGRCQARDGRGAGELVELAECRPVVRRAAGWCRPGRSLRRPRRWRDG